MKAVTTVVRGLDFAEGLRWHDGRLWYSDFYRHGVFAVVPGRAEERVLTLETQPSGLGWLPDGRLLVVSMEGRRVLRREPDGTLVTHADLSEIAGGFVNDMVVAVDGTAHVGNFGFEVWGRDEHLTATLARVAPDGTAYAAADGLHFPNGSVITADGRTLVVGETMAGRFSVLTIADDGTLHDRRVWAELGASKPDGCTLDADGAIWVADAGTARSGVATAGTRCSGGVPCSACRGRRDHAPRRGAAAGLRVRSRR
ncbi:MAG: SMP-30/gluconolactonase/LRE family protein [Acidimicrobiia bacterium]